MASDLKAGDVQTALYQYFLSNARYVVNNVYFFGNGYGETDVLIVKENGMIYDIEVKVSRGDYMADFNKTVKHTIIQHGIRYWGRTWYLKNPITNKRDLMAANEPETIKDRPNRFYFAVPENLIGIHEIPKYAGLYYIKANGQAVKMKEAPLLHKEVLMDVENRLCRKFYYSYITLNTIKKNKGDIGAENKQI